MSNDSVIGNQGEALGTGHHGTFDLQAERTSKFRVRVRKENDARVGPSRFSSPCIHDINIIGRDADGQIHSLLLEFLLRFDEAGQVRLGAPFLMETNR